MAAVRVVVGMRLVSTVAVRFERTKEARRVVSLGVTPVIEAPLNDWRAVGKKDLIFLRTSMGMGSLPGVRSLHRMGRWGAMPGWIFG